MDVKNAVTIATTFLGDLYPDKRDSITLEEVEHLGNAWNVTLSFPGRDMTFLGAPITGKREYKTVEIDDSTGEPRAMKIRVLSA